jgi:hypothetical protein
VDIRRQNTMDRLKSRAEREGKTSTEVNGSLLVNDVVVFSLASG